MVDEDKKQTEQQSPLSEKEQGAKDVIKTGVKTAGEMYLKSHGVPTPIAKMATDKAVNHPMVEGTMNRISRNPLLRDQLAKSKPMINKSKPFLNNNSNKTNIKSNDVEDTTKGKNEDSATDTIGKATKGILGDKLGIKPEQANFNNQGDNEQKTGSGEITNLVKKTKQYWPIIATVAPIVGWIILGFFAVVILLTPILTVYENFDKMKEVAKSVVDKVANCFDFTVFDTYQETFFNKLEYEYDFYKEYRRNNDDLDIALLASTIHYNNIPDPSADKISNNDEEEDYSYNPSDQIIKNKNTKNFYEVAIDQLGSAYTLIPTKKKLIGNMIGTRIVFSKCTKPPGVVDKIIPIVDVVKKFVETSEQIADVYNYFNLSWTKGLEDTAEDILKFNPLTLTSKIYAYAIEKGNSSDYFGSQINELKYNFESHNPWSSFKRIIDNSNFNHSCDISKGEFPIYVIEKHIDYEMYEKYLKEKYIPENYIECTNCNNQYKNLSKQEKEKLIDEMVNDIFNQKEAFMYLTDQFNKSTIYGNIPTHLLEYFAAPFNEPYTVSSCIGGRGVIEKNGQYVSGGKIHKGIDITAQDDNTIYAAADGKVNIYKNWYSCANNNASKCGWNPNQGYNKCIADLCGLRGNYVIIKHDDIPGEEEIYVTKYFHLSKVLVENNAIVSKGDPIGIQGTTGASTGDHLHFEMWQGDSEILMNPANLLNPIKIREGSNCVINDFNIETTDEGGVS